MVPARSGLIVCALWGCGPGDSDSDLDTDEPVWTDPGDDPFADQVVSFEPGANAGLKELGHKLTDSLELCISVRMVRALPRLARALECVPGLLEQAGHRRSAYREALRRENQAP